MHGVVDGTGQRREEQGLLPGEGTVGVGVICLTNPEDKTGHGWLNDI